MSGGSWAELVPQPDSDWLLKAADALYDSVYELCQVYELGVLNGDLVLIEIVARTAVQVLAASEVKGTSASLGIWMAKGLQRARSRLGFRVFSNGAVVNRGAISGTNLNWHDEDIAQVGTTAFDVPVGAIVQRIASYGDHAHDVQWRANGSTFQNPRTAILAMVDPGQQLLRGYFQPDVPLKGKAANDFETAVGWLLWSLRFSPATFGTHAKTRDTLDIVAVSRPTPPALASFATGTRTCTRATPLGQYVPEAGLPNLESPLPCSGSTRTLACVGNDAPRKTPKDAASAWVVSHYCNTVAG